MQRSKCDPFSDGPLLAITRYHLRAALAALRGEPFGYCHVLPSRRGWDAENERWRRASAFVSATENGWSCRGELGPVAHQHGQHTSLSEPVIA